MKLEIGDLIRLRKRRYSVLCIVTGMRPHQIIEGELVYYVKRIDTGEQVLAYVRNIELPEEEQTKEQLS